jgi:hypothetical protein
LLSGVSYSSRKQVGVTFFWQRLTGKLHETVIADEFLFLVVCKITNGGPPSAGVKLTVDTDGGYQRAGSFSFTNVSQ